MVSYRYGFNGMEKDDELKGSGNSYDFGARIYDSRVARWMSPDPFWRIYPDQSPFSGMGNNPVKYIDVDGRYISDIWTTDFYSSESCAVFKKNHNDLKQDAKCYSMIIHDLEASSEWFEFEEDVKVETAQKVYKGYNPAELGRFSKKGGTYFNEHKIYLDNYSSYGRGQYSDLNGVKHKAAIYEEVFHAGQYLHNKKNNIKQTSLQREVEVRIVRAYEGLVLNGGESAVSSFGADPLVKEYLSAIANNKKPTSVQEGGFLTALTTLSMTVYNQYLETAWQNKSEDYIKEQYESIFTFEFEGSYAEQLIEGSEVKK